MKAHIFTSFCEYEKNGVYYTVVKEEDLKLFSSMHKYKYLCDIELPDVDSSEIIQSGVAQIDSNIAALQLKINQQVEKKQQLLAITHDKGETA
jgi:hypothetical protein